MNETQKVTVVIVPQTDLDSGQQGTVKINGRQTTFAFGEPVELPLAMAKALKGLTITIRKSEIKKTEDGEPYTHHYTDEKPRYKITKVAVETQGE